MPSKKAGNIRKEYFSDWRAGFAMRLRSLRLDAALTQPEMMEAIGVGHLGPMLISKLERGSMSRLNVEMIAGLLTWLRRQGYSILWLLLGEGRMRVGDRADLEAMTTEQLMAELARRQVGARLDEYVDRVGAAVAAGLGFGPHAGPDAAGGAPSIHKDARGRGPADPARLVEAGYATVGPDDLPREWHSQYVPIINRVAAGIAVDTAESETGPPGWADEYVRTERPPKGAIALRVVGDSMAPQFAPGDLLIVDPAAPAVAGQPAVVVYRQPGGSADLRATVKIWRPGGGRVTLGSLNPAHKSIALRLDQVAHAYRVHRHLPLMVSRPAAGR